MTAHLPFPRGILLATVLQLLLLIGTAANAQDATTPSGPITPGSLKFNAPVNNVLDYYAQLSGKHLILDSNLSSAGNISINATGLSKEDQLRLMQAALLLNGVAIIPIDEHNAKVVTVGTNKNPRSEGLQIFSNAADLPNDDEVVTYYMPLDYISPQDTAGIFSQTAPVHTYGAYIPVPSAQAVVLTENVSVIKQLIALKQLIDVPPAKVASEWVQLNRADSDKVADILKQMLGLGTAGAPAVAPTSPGGQVFVPPGIGNDQPMSNEKNLISGTAQVISDPRSNRILLVTRPVNLPFLEQMVGQLDQPDIFLVPQRRDLHYVTASDILPALEAALAQGKDEEDQLKKDQQTAQTTQNRPGTPGTPTTTAPASAAGSSSGGGGSQTAITPQLTQPTENDVPTVLTIGKTRLMADNRSNSIIVFGSPDVVSRAFQMIDQLDRKPLQVYLRTVIGELTVTQDTQFGLDILQKFQHVGQGGLATSNVNSGGVGSTVAGPGSVGNGAFPSPTTLTTASLFNTMASGLTIYGAIGSTLDAYLRALEATDRFKIISTPSVYTSNNKLAIIADGEQVPIPSNITSGFTGGTTADDLATTASITYENVLLQLDIIPLINANHEVTLQIRQTNNTLGANVTISNNTVPIVDTQEINTEVTVPNKSTVVIGGLIRDTTERDAQGLPWLSDIPVLGYLFGATDKAKKREELIIMIQPTVVETDADQLAVNEAEKQRTILGREAVQAATGVPPEEQSAILPVQPATTTTVQTSTTISHGAYNSKSGHTGTTTTTTTTTQQIPSQQLTPVGPTSPTGPVPALSTPAPDVQNGKLPPINPPTSPPPPTQTP